MMNEHQSLSLNLGVCSYVHDLKESSMNELNLTLKGKIKNTFDPSNFDPKLFMSLENGNKEIKKLQKREKYLEILKLQISVKSLICFRFPTKLFIQHFFFSLFVLYLFLGFVCSLFFLTKEFPQTLETIKTD